MKESNCPSRDQLAAYLLGNLEEDVSAEIEQRVANCSECQQVLESLDQNRDGLVSLIVDRKDNAKGPGENPVLNSALESLLKTKPCPENLFKV